MKPNTCCTARFHEPPQSHTKPDSNAEFRKTQSFFGDGI